MDSSVFMISIVLSSLGSFLDNYSTWIVIKTGGVELEGNKRVREHFEKHEYKQTFLEETLSILIIGIFDSSELLKSYLFMGLIFFIVRGLVASSNLNVFIESRTMGMNAYLEQRKSHRQMFKSLTFGNKIKSVLTDLLGASICLICYGILCLMIDLPLLVFTRYLVLGLVFYFLVVVAYSFN